MAKAKGYIDEYEAALNSYNRLVDEYNTTLDKFMGSVLDEGRLLQTKKIGKDLGKGYYSFQVSDGLIGRKPESSYQAEILGVEGKRDKSVYTIRDPETGKVYSNITKQEYQDGDRVLLHDGTILKFSPTPGDFTQTAPSFDMEKYKNLLTEDMATEQQAIKDALAKTQAEERAKFDQQRAEMTRQQAILSAETAAAERQAQQNLASAQADAAAASAERQKKEKEFKTETESLQRDVGARRAGYVRSRRMRSRSLLSGA